MNRSYPAVNTNVRDEPIPRNAPLCTRPVAALTEEVWVLDYYGGVAAALKRAIRCQTLADTAYRSVGEVIDCYCSRRTTRLLEADFDR